MIKKIKDMIKNRIFVFKTKEAMASLKTKDFKVKIGDESIFYSNGNYMTTHKNNPSFIINNVITFNRILNNYKIVFSDILLRSILSWRYLYRGTVKYKIILKIVLFKSKILKQYPRSIKTLLIIFLLKHSNYVYNVGDEEAELVFFNKKYNVFVQNDNLGSNEIDKKQVFNLVYNVLLYRKLLGNIDKLTSNNATS